ncbi:MAG TPA: D-isomer specific 2-hydroxyacid dehydrogenase family protein [Actinomycetota bacterium]|nr:D-isomer specific 2-hydroxyacid dehydrogenase family protein [Actinomycetota bacterium]
MTIARLLVVDPLLIGEGFDIGADWAGPEHDVVVPGGFGIEQLRPHLADAEGLLTAHAPVTEEMMAQAPLLRVVAKPGAGVDNIDIQAAKRRGVTVTNVPGARGRAVAEHALFLLLFLARRGWMRDDPAWRRALATQLGGKTLGIVGLGDIGGHLARFGHGLGMDVVAHTRTPGAARVPDVPVRFVDLATLLRGADAVVLCVPLSEETRGLIDRAALAAMKSDAVLINVSRGPVVVTDDLLEAMRAGRLAGAGLDVTDPEPLPDDHGLRDLPNVLLSPHNAGRTVESQAEALARMRENVRLALSGAPPIDPVG